MSLRRWQESTTWWCPQSVIWWWWRWNEYRPCALLGLCEDIFDVGKDVRCVDICDVIGVCGELFDIGGNNSYFVVCSTGVDEGDGACAGAGGDINVNLNSYLLHDRCSNICYSIIR